MPRRPRRPKADRTRASRRRSQRRVVRRDQVSMQGEADHIVRCARGRETHVVSLPPLVFFSTEAGDAWMLDAEDHFAAQLARDGERLRSVIQETPTQFRIDWPATFEIRGDAFHVAKRSGSVRIIMGYPLEDIERAIRAARAP